MQVHPERLKNNKITAKIGDSKANNYAKSKFDTFKTFSKTEVELCMVDRCASEVVWTEPCRSRSVSISCGFIKQF